MKNSFVRFLVTTFFFSILVGAAAFLFDIAVPSVTILPTDYFIILYFFIITVTFHYGLLRSRKGKPQEFVRYFMAATTVKLLIHVAVVIGYALLHREHAFNFIISFFVVYVLYIVYEVRFAMKINLENTN